MEIRALDRGLSVQCISLIVHLARDSVHKRRCCSVEIWNSD